MVVSPFVVDGYTVEMPSLEEIQYSMRLEVGFATALSPASRVHSLPTDVYCTLSVTLVELCAPVVTSVAVTTTV
jgi:hypothetical protein